jgi:hypothetical protein
VADDLLYQRAVRRINRFTLILAFSGTLVCAAQWGWRGAAGFTFGTLATWLNFRWIKHLVDSLGETPKSRRAAVFAVLLGLRYVLLGAAGYVILKFFEVNLLATLAGLLTVVAAVIFEALYQLVTYA